MNAKVSVSARSHQWSAVMPVRIDIHLGVIKIANDEIYHDFQSNNTEYVIVGTERDEVLQRTEVWNISLNCMVN
jgi:hypothetical protein